MSLIKYRADIDGLRAIAIVSVLLFHFQKNLLPGGFVGVDVFFVISGYLISSIVIGECEHGQFSFLRFYQRRVARIFPLFFLVSLTTLLTASVLYTSQNFAAVGSLVTAAALSVANLKLMLQGNYFELSPDAQPLLHFWSLAVEEQFYFVFPLIIYLAFRIKLTRRVLFYTLILLAAISFTACIALTISQPTWAFYLLPTRAWELLAGCILAAYHRPDLSTGNRRLAPMLSNIGLLVIIASVSIIHEGMSFPGFVAAIPVIGAVLLIGCSNNSQSMAEKLLSHPSLVLIGKMSYSLYLWHWPIYCFVDYSLYSQSFLVRSILKASLTIGCSIVSYYWFEKPTRLYLNQPQEQVLSFIGLAVGVTAFIVIGLFINTNNYINASPNTVKNGGIAFNSNHTKPVVVLMGDSNGSMYGKTVKEITEQLPIRTHVISVAAGDALPETELYKDSLLFINSAKPEITIFVNAWAQKIGNNRQRFKTALSALLDRSQHVIILTQPPALPKSASRQKIRESGRMPIFEDAEFAHLRKDTNAFLLSHNSDRVHVLEISPLFEKPNGEIRFTDIFERQLYHDTGHLSAHGSELVKKLVVPEISRILTLPSSRSGR